MRRTFLALGSLAAVAFALAACASEPEPEPAWTEEEAFAAAEETFREYWGLDIFATPEEVKPYVTGDMIDAHHTEAPNLDGRELDVRGSSLVTGFSPVELRFVGDHAVVVAEACIDRSDLEINVDGQGWVPPRDDQTYGVKIEFESIEGAMLVSDLTEPGDIEC